MPNFFKKLVKEVSRPITYAARTGSSQTYETGRSNTGGQIVQIKTISLTDSTPQVITQTNFDTHLRNKGINEAGITHFQCLKWVEVGSRQRLEFHHKPNQTTCEKIGVAVRRIDDNNLRVSIIWKQSSVRVSDPLTIIQKRTSHYGFGYKQSDDSTQTIGRGLTPDELANVKQALQTEANRHNPEVEALENV